MKTDEEFSKQFFSSVPTHASDCGTSVPSHQLSSEKA